MRGRNLFLFLAIFFIFSCVEARAEVQIKVSNPSSKPTKVGLFPEEVITLKELRNKQILHEPFILLDARGKKSYDEAHIEGALLPLSKDYYEQEELFRAGIIKALPNRDKDLARKMVQYPKNTPVVTYCNDHCQASVVLLLQMKNLGFANVRVLEEGIQSWQAAGYPVKSS